MRKLIEAGKNVVENIGEAVGEVAMLATESIDPVRSCRKYRFSTSNDFNAYNAKKEL